MPLFCRMCGRKNGFHFCWTRSQRRSFAAHCSEGAIDVAHRAARGAGGERSIGLSAAETLRLRCGGCQAPAPLASIAARRRANSSAATARWMERAGMSISMRSPSSTRPIAPPSAASGETWPIDRPEVPPEKRPSVTQRADLAQALRLQVAGRVEHFLHAGAAPAALRSGSPRRRPAATLPPRMPLDRLVLALEDARRARENFRMRGVDAGGLHDAAVLGDVAVEHGQAAVLREGVRRRRGCTPVARSRSSSS